ncbi:MAG: hypothetical protein WC998_05070 [Candidatus Paceibacterota bacterium]|jgi:hypothetical protein
MTTAQVVNISTGGLKLLLGNSTIKTVTGFFVSEGKETERVRITKNKNDPKDIKLSIGKPNYSERKFLKSCKETNSRIPRFWVKYFPEKKK